MQSLSETFNQNIQDFIKNTLTNDSRSIFIANILLHLVYIVTEIIISFTTDKDESEHYALIGLYVVIFFFVKLSWVIFARSTEEYKWFDTLVFVVIILHALGIFILNGTFGSEERSFEITYRMAYYYTIDVIYFNVFIRTVSMRNSGIILVTLFYIVYLAATVDHAFETYAILYILQIFAGNFLFSWALGNKEKLLLKEIENSTSQARLWKKIVDEDELAILIMDHNLEYLIHNKSFDKLYDLKKVDSYMIDEIMTNFKNLSPNSHFSREIYDQVAEYQYKRLEKLGMNPATEMALRDRPDTAFKNFKEFLQMLEIYRQRYGQRKSLGMIDIYADYNHEHFNVTVSLLSFDEHNSGFMMIIRKLEDSVSPVGAVRGTAVALSIPKTNERRSSVIKNSKKSYDISYELLRPIQAAISKYKFDKNRFQALNDIKQQGSSSSSKQNGHQQQNTFGEPLVVVEDSLRTFKKFYIKGFNSELDYKLRQNRGFSSEDMLAPTPIKLKGFISKTLELLREEAKEKSIRLEYEIDTSVPYTITTDENLLSLVLFNILENCLRFTQHGSIKIYVSTKKETIDDISEAHDDDLLDNSSRKLMSPMANMSFSKKPNGTGEYITFEVRDSGFGLERETRKNILAGLDDNVSSSMYSLPSLAIAQKVAKMLGKGIKFNYEVGTGSNYSFKIDPSLETTRSTVLIKKNKFNFNRESFRFREKKSLYSQGDDRQYLEFDDVEIKVHELAEKPRKSSDDKIDISTQVPRFPDTEKKPGKPTPLRMKSQLDGSIYSSRRGNPDCSQVLVIDDDYYNRNILQNIFNKLEFSYEIHAYEAANPNRVRAIFENLQSNPSAFSAAFRVAFINIEYYQIYEALSQLKALRQYMDNQTIPNFPIIAIIEENLLNDEIKLSFNDIILKPATKYKLEETISFYVGSK